MIMTIPYRGNGAMMETDCFSKETLQEYLSGTSHDDPAEIEHHLVGCPKCEETLRQLEGSSDAFVAPLRQHSVDLPSRNRIFNKPWKPPSD